MGNIEQSNIQHSHTQSYSSNDQVLIQQLVQSRMKQNANLEYESFEGYELPPATQFSMLKKPAVSIRLGTMTFNMACIRLFTGVKHILPMVHPNKRRLTTVPCAEEEASTTEWARQKNDDVWVNKDITSPEFLEKVFRLMHWDRNCRYKVLGRVTNSPRGLVLVFDLNEAILFTQPEEYIDKKTGEIKKRLIKYYPDEYKDRIGKTYDDYMAVRQVNMFETLDGYAGMTYSDARESEKQSIVAKAPTVEKQQISAEGTVVEKVTTSAMEMPEVTTSPNRMSENRSSEQRPYEDGRRRT